MSAPEPVWRPDPEWVERSRITAFARAMEREHGVDLPDYDALHRWSTDHLEQFWSGVWRFFDVRSDREPAPDRVLVSRAMPGAHWFPDVRLNYVDQVFAGRDPDQVAVVAVTEPGDVTQLTWRELAARVAGLAHTLRELGVSAGDRVVGYLPNTVAPLVGFLATASLGAVWSCCAPDYAAPAAANRLAQLEPVVLVCADGAHFGGRAVDRRAEAVRLAGLLPSVRHVVHVRHLGTDPLPFPVPVTDWEEATTSTAEPLHAEPVSFEHPLWVLYSSGTTGVPKGLVHGHGGVVLDALKVMGLHVDVGPSDRVFWYTTTNWMMWNFNASALLAGASIVVYDGSPAAPHTGRLWELAAEVGVTVLGTSPGYLQACEKQGVRLGPRPVRAATDREHRFAVAGRRLPLGRRRTRRPGPAGVDLRRNRRRQRAGVLGADTAGVAGRDLVCGTGCGRRCLRRRREPRP